ncbi:DUF3488 and DUF4129 domain-containing transglutaminase family protein [Niallia oryzisoli]|uniref:transglutaminase TgpA family protein n=1 Tax=Niallia oryzisoli TaxID=1737571 RepID=UPI003735301E
MKRWKDATSLLLYSLGFLLLLEWIWPIKSLSESAEISVFLLFILVCLLLFFLRAPMYVSILIKGSVIVYFLHFLYFKGSFFQADWIPAFINDIKLNSVYVFSGKLMEVSHLYRSLFFFIILWMMVYLLEYWLFRRRKILIFFFMTLVYVTFLDTFTPYDASGAVVRIVLVGFLIVGILTFLRHFNNEKLKTENIMLRKWVLVLSMMVLCSASLGYILPKSQPIWPDPVPALQVFTGFGSTKKVGYGEDDTQLGGSIAGDSTVVFQTIVESPHYWKVETKDVYTGKGWIQSEEDKRNIPFWGNSTTPITSFVEGSNYEQSILKISTVHQIKAYPHLLYPLGIKRIQSDRGYSFELDPSIEKIYSFNGGESVPLESYSVTYEIPYYTADMLRTNVTDSAGVSFMSRYTQLPDQLPSRVKELAAKITKGKTNRYDQTKAVEQYFKTGSYSYSLTDVAVPNEDEDYVDQFLFETLQGYCDNFSTSMVVLLRSLDIPARWVKGYTEGSYTGMEGDLYKYEITNNNAHSWVEVYFSEVGWVPFEPTPGFTNEAAATTEEGEEKDNTEANVQPEEQEKEKLDELNQNENSQTENKAVSSNSIGDNLKKIASAGWFLLIVLVILLLLTVYYAYRIRKKWLPAFYIRKYMGSDKDELFISAYASLLKQLKRIGMERDTGLTLRDYAKEIDERYSTTEMTRLTRRYEQYLYGNQLQKGTWNEMKELWENLIKKTIA